ncbi:MAG: Holliday junction resolvase RuvX [Clostridiales bacterium]|nr:MAG: Holliday junction resolvase RuvX [Clostridiales bacterium]
MRILALDYGLARTGLAISDLSGVLATPLFALPSYNTDRLIAEIQSVIEEKGVTEIIMGLPARTDGQKSEMQNKVRDFASQLTDKTGMKIKFIDEKFTTVIASQKLHQNNINSKKQKGMIDAAAAAVMLQDWIDSHRK